MRITRLGVRRVSPRRLRALALLGSLPLIAVAAFQVALWLGAPYGEAVLGGHAETAGGVLTWPYRWAAVGQAGLLLAMAWVLLARGGFVYPRRVSIPGLRTAAAAIAAFMALNTVANLTAPDPLERWMGAATLTVCLASAALAIARTPAAGRSAHDVVREVAANSTNRVPGSPRGWADADSGSGGGRLGAAPGIRPDVPTQQCRESWSHDHS